MKKNIIFKITLLLIISFALAYQVFNKKIMVMYNYYHIKNEKEEIISKMCAQEDILEQKSCEIFYNCMSVEKLEDNTKDRQYLKSRISECLKYIE